MQRQLIEFCNILVDDSDGKLKLKFDVEGEFLANDINTCYGRDIRIYNFMFQVAGMAFTLASLIEEILLPIKSFAPGSYNNGLDYLRRIGNTFLRDDELRAWQELMRDF